MKKTCFCLLISTCLWKCHSENQGPRVASKDKGGAAQPAEGPQGRACPPPRRQGHRWRTQQALQDVLSLSLSLSLSLYLVYIFLCFQIISFWFFGIWFGFSFLVVQKGCEAVYCAGFDCDFTEAKGGSERSLQEEEVPATRSASQED